MNYPKNIGLVDFSHMLTVNFKARANDAGPNEAGQATLTQLAGVRELCEHVVVCLDHGPYWRRLRYDQYKRGREREPEYEHVYKWTVERVEKDGYRIASAKSQEADDVIATLAHAYAGADKCRDVRIIGADKDALQCVTEYVRCFAPKGRGEYEIRDAQWVLEKYEVTPDKMSLLLAIMGDTSDNIPGIKGIGVKTAAKLINTFGDPAGMAVALTSAMVASQQPGAKPLAATWRYYADGMARLPLWVELTTLRRDADVDAADLLKPGKIVPLVADDEQPPALGDEPEDDDGLDWDAIASEQAEKDRAEAERAKLAESLPVGPAPTADRAPIIGKDPGADAFLEKAAAARAMPASGPEQARVNEAAAEGWERKAAQASPAAGPITDADRKEYRERIVYRAPEIMTPREREIAAAIDAEQKPAPEPPKPAPAAEVVPKTRGPRKVDDIPDDGALTRVPVPAPNWALAVQPNSAREMMAIAKTMINARYFGSFGTPEGVFAVMALGRELGLGMAQSLQGFFIVQNRPFASSAMLRALVQKHPDCAYFVCTHSDDKSATFELRRKSWPEGMKSSLTYTWEQAVAAKLTTGANRENWLTKPTEMLSKTAAAKLARREFADATFGLHVESEVV